MNSSTRFFGSGYGQCSICETPLDVHEQLQGFCGSPECLRKAALRADNEKRTRKKAQLMALVEEMLESLPGCDTGGAISAVVTPSNDRQLSRLPADRLEAFSEHLQGLFTGILDEKDTDPKEQKSNRTASSEEENSIYARACGFCRGKCCLQGNSAQAFISENTIRRQVSQIDEKLHRELFSQYIRLIPEYSFENSCVYHGETGCALPRTMRADICNSFLCEHLKSIDYDQVVKTKKILLVAEDNYQPIRSDLIASDV